MEKITEDNIARSMNIFMTERSQDEVNLVYLVEKALREYLGSGVADNFLGNPDIKSIEHAMPEVQRVIINRHFVIKLFIFRYHNAIDILSPLSYLISDGTYTDWFYCFKTYVMPFLKEHNVLTCLIGD